MPCFKLTLTHEEIGEIIGTTRENREPPFLGIQEETSRTTQRRNPGNP
jgi:hypothetical protein